jgi:hypothetical protein
MAEAIKKVFAAKKEQASLISIPLCPTDALAG